jgi:cytoskeletal protein CcmA (bactofilin family)
MWINEPQTKAPSLSPAQASQSPVSFSGPTTSGRGSSSNNVSRVGSTLKIKGTISGAEDLEIDGKVEGPISLPGQKITVGATGQLTSEITAREAVVHGKISGNIYAGDRVEIKNGSDVIGDITTARIGIEDGAHFKGRIEIDRPKPLAAVDLKSISAPMVTEMN